MEEELNALRMVSAAHEKQAQSQTQLAMEVQAKLDRHSGKHTEVVLPFLLFVINVHLLTSSSACAPIEPIAPTDGGSRVCFQITRGGNHQLQEAN